MRIVPNMELETGAQFVTVDDNADFLSFMSDQPSGIRVIATKFGEGKEPVLRSDAGDFLKWLRREHRDLVVEVPPAKRLLLHSDDIWIPLVFLATDVTLPMYLNIISNYLYDRARGRLRKEEKRVHLSAEYIDGKSGSVKRFNFDGTPESLRSTIKKIDVNRFMEG